MSSIWLPEAQNLKSWYDYEVKCTSMASIDSDMGAAWAGGLRSMYYDRVFLSHITSDPNMGQEKFECHHKPHQA
ncbi:unnamed protein product [Urochloa humidicola]